MSTERDVTPIVRSWLEIGPTALPDRVLSEVLGRLPATPQRRPRWPTRRLTLMSTPVRITVAAAAIGLFAVAGINVFPRWGDVGGPAVVDSSPSVAPSPISGPSPAPVRQGLLPAGTYVGTPFAPPEGSAGSDACSGPEDPMCTEAVLDDTIRISFTVPDGWSGNDTDGLELATGWGQALDGAAVIFVRGASLYNDPCDDGSGRIPVGPTAADFADALDEHPLLDVTTPFDVIVGGYAGKYLDLQVPSDPTIQGSSEPDSLEGCPIYRPWELWYFARMGGERWHLWIIDVADHRVVVQAMVHEATTPEVEAQLQAIVDSIEIEPATAPVASPSAAQLAVPGWPGTGANPAGVYSWRPGGQLRSWMHNYHESGDVEITFGSWDEATESTRSLIAAAGYDDGSYPAGPVRVSDDRPVGTAEAQRQVWLLDVDGTRVFMLIKATPGTPAAALAEAEAIVGSVQVGPPSLGPGIVLTFELPDGWDSG